MRRSQDGDRLAYRELLVEVTALVRVFVRKRLGLVDGLEDVVQETLLSIHRYRHTYDPGRPFRPWMYAIARHRLLDFVGKRRRHSEHEVVGEGNALAEATQTTGTVLEPGGALGYLHQALALITIKQREIIHMLKFEGCSVAEVSAKTGLSESSVKVTAHRGYKRLRELMESPAHED